MRSDYYIYLIPNSRKFNKDSHSKLFIWMSCSDPSEIL